MKKAIMKYKNIVILTGAGISAESGINTFRSSDGLWESHRIEDVATPEGYLNDPILVQDFYNKRRQQLLSDNVTPNAAHQALSLLANHPNIELTLVTQNIDNLHERGGVDRVIHMHGELLKARCPESEQVVDCESDLDIDTHCHCCQIPSPMRPHIVWFGEMPLRMDEIYHKISQCDLFIAIGTSGVVYPAAGFVHEANHVGAHTIEVNLEPSALQSEFHEKRYGKASVEVPLLVNELIEP
ncbi:MULTISPECIES: Sir2 family NAD+-dependent deacetylase [unclassified Vibrio]|uniref:NAD-dependent protein deacylase n=1 Tax=Vibrio sp. HB236076 TaxID=3232307 RepID=A0AB39HHY1_9VIBR|nr:Sir2 family NAD+-dependent deacetylase [Vibrio sp. HB161653]MDP5253415.1 NAD-dependent protein deacylase [Vibrio sp. HB161653]